MAEIIKVSDTIIKLTEKKQRNEQMMLYRLNNLFREHTQKPRAQGCTGCLPANAGGSGT